MVFSKIRLPEIVHEEENKEQEKVGGLWSHKLFILSVAALFCYEIAEISINSFFINYVVDDGWMNARDASVVLSFSAQMRCIIQLPAKRPHINRPNPPKESTTEASRAFIQPSLCPIR